MHSIPKRSRSVTRGRLGLGGWRSREVGDTRWPQHGRDGLALPPPDALHDLDLPRLEQRAAGAARRAQRPVFVETCQHHTAGGGWQRRSAGSRGSRSARAVQVHDHTSGTAELPRQRFPPAGRLTGGPPRSRHGGQHPTRPHETAGGSRSGSTAPVARLTVILAVTAATASAGPPRVPQARPPAPASMLAHPACQPGRAYAVSMTLIWSGACGAADRRLGMAWRVALVTPQECGRRDPPVPGSWEFAVGLHRHIDPVAALAEVAAWFAGRHMPSRPAPAGVGRDQASDAGDGPLGLVRSRSAAPGAGPPPSARSSCRPSPSPRTIPAGWVPTVGSRAQPPALSSRALPVGPTAALAGTDGMHATPAWVSNSPDLRSGA